MQRRRYSSRSHRRFQLVLLATASLFGSGLDASADSPLVEVTSTPIPAERAGNEVELQAPTNSTLEIRIARRPWLFDKLLKPSPPPSIKMNPPRPPSEIAVEEAKSVPAKVTDRPAAADPPSKSLIVPSRDQGSDGWIARGKRAIGTTFADLSDEPEETKTVAPSKVDDDSDSSTESEGWFQNSTRQLRAPKIVDTPTEENDPTRNDSVSESMAAEVVDAKVVDAEASEAEVSPADSVDREVLSQEVSARETSKRNVDSKVPQGEVTIRSPQAASSIPQDDGGAKAARDLGVPSADVAQQEPEMEPLTDPKPEQRNEPTTKGGTTSSSPTAESRAAESDVGETEATAEISDDLADAEVEVRKLRIEPDGTPVGEANDSEAIGSKAIGSKAIGSKAIGGERQLEKAESARGSVTRSVGDLPPGASVSDDQVGNAKSLSQTLPQVELDYTGRPSEPIRLTNTVARMKNAMKSCLRYYYSRPENANERSNWGMLHSIMVFGADTKIVAGSKTYSAIAWIAGNNSCRGKKLIQTRDGQLSANSGIGLQGHQAQMLAVFALCDVPAEYPLYADDEKYSIQDLIDAEMLACRSGEELTFTLIGLSHYLDTDAVWRNAEGEVWDFERLLREELAQTIVGAACGGTHRLMGYAHALRKRRAEGGAITGQWKRAEIYTQDFIRYAYRLQNRDGSMSTDWFEGREDNGDLDRKIQTTGHMVEWLLTITPDDQLQDRRLVSAVRFLLSSMYNERTHEWKIGPKGHALRSLAMYYERVYQQGPAWRATGVANTRSNQRR